MFCCGCPMIVMVVMVSVFVGVGVGAASGAAHGVIGGATVIVVVVVVVSDGTFTIAEADPTPPTSEPTLITSTATNSRHPHSNLPRCASHFSQKLVPR